MNSKLWKEEQRKRITAVKNRTRIEKEQLKWKRESSEWGHEHPQKRSEVNMMETSVNTDGLKYNTSGRIVRPGGRHFKTIEEKEREGQEAQKKAELQGQTRARIEERFLTPRAKNFVETPEVAELANTVHLWNTAGYPVHIIGPTGCGKTTLALAVAERFNRPAVWINGDAEMTTSDLV
ncbi:MAG: AAA family ATPase, partial [Candidatus Methanoperedens sp.]|nr:AAA family ATPase [Candidatus Methanoperedens sp.]